jgi:hypothetical protein
MLNFLFLCWKLLRAHYLYSWFGLYGLSLPVLSPKTVESKFVCLDVLRLNIYV